MRPRQTLGDWMYGANRAMCVVPGQEREIMKQGPKAEKDPQKLASQLDSAP